jgi:predicted nucleotidyltransferase
MVELILQQECDTNSVEVYVFGSITEHCHPRDIDLILVYNTKLISINELLQLRNKLYFALRELLDIEIDICLLSQEENTQSCFTELEEAIKIL